MMCSTHKEDDITTKKKLKQTLKTLDEVLEKISRQKQVSLDENLSKLITHAENLLNSLSNDESLNILKRRASFLELKGKILLFKAKTDQAITYLKESLDIHKKINNPRKLVDAYLQLGDAYLEKGELETALNLCKKALHMTQRREFDDKKQLIRIYKIMGTTYWKLGQDDLALDFYLKCLQMGKEIKDDTEIAAAHNNIGIIHAVRNDFYDALEHFKKSFFIHKKIGRKNDMAITLNNMGKLYGHVGRLEDSLECYFQSLFIWKEMGNETDVALVLNNIASLYHEMGRIEEALHYTNMSLQIRKKIGNPQDIAVCLHNLGIIYLEKDNLELALEYLERGLSLRETVGNILEISSSVYQLTLVHSARNDRERTKHYLQYLRQLSENCDLKQVKMRYLIAQAMVWAMSTKSLNRHVARLTFDILLNSEELDHEFFVPLTFASCNLLLKEYLRSQSPFLLDEIRSRMQRLKEIGETQLIPSLLADAYCIQGIIEGIQGHHQAAKVFIHFSRVLYDHYD